MPRTSATNPPYADTVAKYVKETNADRDKVAAEIARFAARLGLPDNLDFAAWQWVKQQGLQPPPLNQQAPFTVLDKPYVTMLEGLKTPANTGFTVRGYFIHGKLGATKKGNDMYVITLADESGVKDILIFGEKVKVAADFAAGLKAKDAIRLTSLQVMGNKDQSPALSGGNFTGYTRIVDDKENVFKLPKFTDLPATPLRDLEIFETAIVRGLAYSYEIATYTGCPNCKTKFRDNTAPGRPAECSDREFKGIKKKGCGIVTAKEMSFITLVIVDQRFDVKLKFNPDQSIPEATLKEWTENLKPVWAIGSLQKNDTFRVDWYDLESNLGGPNVGSATGVGLPNRETVTITPPSQTSTTIPPQSTPSVVTVTPPPTPILESQVLGTALPNSELQRAIDEDLMEYMNVFQGTADMSSIINYFQRRSVDENKAKTIILEAIMQKKIVKDGNTVRKVTA